MSEPPRRYKTDEELDGDEVLARIQAERRHDPRPEFERPEYHAARNQALRDAGFDPDDDDAEPTPLEEMTAEQHFQAQRTRRP